MDHSSFDAKQAVTFDLPNGQVKLGTPGPDGTDSRRCLIVPADALAAVAAAAGETASRELGRSLGAALGARVRARIGGDGQVRDGAVDRVLNELGTELALAGLGRLSLERWGRALVLVVSGSGVEGRGADVFVASTLEGLLASATGRDLRTMPLARDGDRLRVLVANVASIERVVAWMAEGASWGDAIVRLHAPRTEAAP